MTNKGKNIDQFFKEQFSDAELPLDGSEWGRLEQAIQPQSKRKLGFWWILGVGVALTVAGISFLNWGSDSKKPTIQTAQAINIDAQTQSQQVLINPNPNKKELAEENSERLKVDNKATLEKKSPQNNAQNVLDNSKNQSSILANSNIEETHTTSDVHFTKESSAVQASQHNAIALNKSIETLTPTELQKIEINSEWFNVSNPNLSAITKSVDPDLLPELVPGKWSNSIAISAQPYSVINAGNNDYSKQKSSNEVFGVGYEIGYTSAYQFAKFSASTGVLFEHQQTRYTKNGLVLTLYDSIPFIDHKLDTFYVPFNYRDTLIASENFKAPSYQYISIPLQFTKTFEIGAKWNVDAAVEARPQFLVRVSGETQTALNRMTTLSIAELQRFNIRLGGHATINFKPTKKLTLYTKIIYLDDLKPRLTMNGLDQKLRTAGISLGIKLQMN